jgi:Leucine-rich repeat (LRR) protein
MHSKFIFNFLQISSCLKKQPDWEIKQLVYLSLNNSHLDLSYTSLPLNFEKINDKTYQKILEYISENNLGIRSIDLSGNAITKIRSLKGDIFPDLQKINLSNNEIKIIRSNEFSTFPSLRVIDLSNNRISKTFQDSFSIDLEELNLQNNQISAIPQKSFENLKNLKKLVLSQNQLVNLDVNLFENCLKLTTLDLSENNLTRLESDLFKKCKKLTDLAINSNELASFPENLSEILPNIKILYAHSNNFVIDWSSFEYFPRLHTISIDFENTENFLSEEIIESLTVLMLFKNRTLFRDYNRNGILKCAIKF